MKKIITIFLVFTMLFSATTFFVCAEEVGIGNKTVDVQAKAHTVTFMPTGSLPSDVTEYTSVGTITIVLKESKA